MLELKYVIIREKIVQTIIKGGNYFTLKILKQLLLNNSQIKKSYVLILNTVIW